MKQEDIYNLLMEELKQESHHKDIYSKFLVCTIRFGARKGKLGFRDKLAVARCLSHDDAQESREQFVDKFIAAIIDGAKDKDYTLNDIHDIKVWPSGNLEFAGFDGKGWSPPSWMKPVEERI